MDLLILVGAISIASVQARMAFDVHGYFECREGVPSERFDMSNLEFGLNANSDMVVDGNFSFLLDSVDPWPWTLTSEHFQRGRWIPGIISKKVDNFCDPATLHNPIEPWFGLIKHFKIQSCPFPAGHVETFNKLNVGSMGMLFPSQFEGEWKFYLEGLLLKNGTWKKDCVMTRLSMFVV